MVGGRLRGLSDPPLDNEGRAEAERLGAVLAETRPTVVFSSPLQLKQYIAQGTLQIEYRPIAFLDQMSTDRYSNRALNAAAAVVNGTPGAYEGFHEALFAQQPGEGGPGLTDRQLIELAVAAGASRACVTTAVEHQTDAGWVASVTENASKANTSRFTASFELTRRAPGSERLATT